MKISLIGRFASLRLLIATQVLCASWKVGSSQIVISASTATTFSTATEGDLYQDENDVVYIGMQDRTLRRIWPEQVKTFEVDGSELIFTDEAGVESRFDLGDKKVYEKTVIWAEESGGLSDNTLEWSFANGDEGFIGLPLPEEWEAYAVSFHADNTRDNNDEVQIDVVDIIGDGALNVLFSFTASGDEDNMTYTELLATPVMIPAGTVLGFRTNNENRSVSSARVAVWLRRRVSY